MKKCTMLLAFSVALIFVSLLSCKKDKGDVLEGTWKYAPAYDIKKSEGSAEHDMTYKFDGKGNFTYSDVELTGFVLSTAKGTYTIEENNTIVCIHGEREFSEGFSKEYDSELSLDLESKPAKLTAIRYYTSSGEYIGALVFEKQ